MTARNGDKARHALQRRKVRAQRVKIRELLKSKTPQPAEAKSAK